MKSDCSGWSDEHSLNGKKVRSSTLWKLYSSISPKHFGNNPWGTKLTNHTGQSVPAACQEAGLISIYGLVQITTPNRFFSISRLYLAWFSDSLDSQKTCKIRSFQIWFKPHTEVVSNAIPTGFLQIRFKLNVSVAKIGFPSVFCVTRSATQTTTTTTTTT